ncbi:MAG: LysR substrate-binding domain-containing protein [Pseudomonadaceae bacterium]|nr:LysR substrate-binding domain-containing protein [Pseudomonadaceae bacterium]
MARPSLRSLEIFAMAGRCGSFREAAEQLHLSPSAVSHQIKGLENWIGAPLFIRSTRSIELTELGQKLSKSCNTHLQAVNDVLDAAKLEHAETALRISALPLFTDTWLIPRLAKFEKRWPDIRLEIETVNDVVDLNTSNIDVGIRNTRSATPGLTTRKLISLQSVPLCAPELAEKINSIADLCHHTLIVHSGRPASWHRWFELCGHPDLAPVKTLLVDNMHSAVSAAQRGAGVMMGLAPFIWEAGGVNALVNPVKAKLISDGAYRLVYRRTDRTRPLIQDFERWIVEEMQADKPRLMQLGEKRIY